jgi:hypothetical protein
MRRFYVVSRIIILAAIMLMPASVHAQTYSFSLDSMGVDVFWEDDGSMRLEYLMEFTNDTHASPLDYVDVGLPTEYYDLSSAEASVDGHSISHIAPSAYVEYGVELGLGANAIPPGETGKVHFTIAGIRDVLYYDDDDSEYASAVFMPTNFDREFVHGSTELLVVFHLPPGVQPDEPRWHESPSGWPYDSPSPSIDSSGRVVYVWENLDANGYTDYKFGASFPRKYVPEETILTPSISYQLGISEETLMGGLCCGGVVLVFGGFIALAVFSARRRKLAYLPPKIAIEGHGIKRGLTAIEAAVLLETPLDRVLTMILFSTIKKNATRVVKEDPLKLERLTPKPEGLRPYEEEFLKAMIDEKPGKQKAALQKLMIDLVQAVQKKMKGFSLKETRDYYKSIMEKAWKQVEQAETPEVRSQRFDDGLEWTMLDDDFDDRTQRTFRTGPVYVPIWWGNYRPSYRPSGTAVRTTGRVPSSSAGRGMTLPKLPGSEFAASIVNGVQNTAKNLVSNVTSFTDGVTKTTNPPPPPSRSTRSWSSGGGGGGSSCACACACACAGCACACAGGGR